VTRDELPHDTIRGIALFDTGDYFEAHEALESAWRAEPGPIRNLYRGILQVAVGYLHILRGNYTGARKMIQRSRRWLEPFPDEIAGIDLHQFRADYERVDAILARLGPERIDAFDRSILKPLPWKEQE
jgi:uncharacterized protein